MAAGEQKPGQERKWRVTNGTYDVLMSANVWLGILSDFNKYT